MTSYEINKQERVNLHVSLNVYLIASSDSLCLLFCGGAARCARNALRGSADITDSL